MTFILHSLKIIGKKKIKTLLSFILLFSLVSTSVYSQLDSVAHIIDEEPVFEDGESPFKKPLGIVHPSKIKEAEYYFYKAVEKGKKGESEAALNLFTKAIEVNPKYWFAYQTRGLLKIELKDFQGALTDFTKELTMIKAGEPYYYRGITFLALRNVKAALEDFKKAIEFSPRYEEAYSKMGLAQFFLEDYNNALKSLNIAIDIFELNKESYLYRGIVHYHLEKYAESIEDFDKAIQLDSSLMGTIHFRKEAIKKLKN